MPTYGGISTTYAPQTKRQAMELLRTQLDTERQSWITHWRELADFILPRRARFQLADANRGERRTQKIIDSTATLASRTARSGMMSGLTSPARPWFRLTVPDPELAEYGPVKDWLYLVTKRMETAFLRSNVYHSLPILYGDLVVFGTGSMLVEEDFTGDVIRTYPFPIGSYMIAQDERLLVNVFLREFRMTVRQIVMMFGYQNPGAGPGKTEPEWEHFSENVKRLWENKQHELWIDVVHVIAPNDDYDPNRGGSEYKKFRSCYYERGNTSYGSGVQMTYDDRFLRISGYDRFPILSPRWETTAEDVYGSSCPGMIALGDIKQLQTGERRAAQAIEKMVNPPMVAPNVLKTVRASTLPGDVTYVDEPTGAPGFRPAHEVRFSVSELESKQTQVRDRIRRAFYEDLFLMLSLSDRREITAREVDERHEEKLLALGPVLEQLNQDLLNPLIDITFDVMAKQDLIPPAPEEIQGSRLKVEYISIMAHAQKLAGIAGIERFTSFAAQVAQVDPQVLDKINRDELIDEYAEITGIPPGIVVPDDEVAAVRQAREQAAQAQVATEQVAAGAKAAKDLSSAKLEEDSALSRLLSTAEAGQVTPGL